MVDTWHNTVCTDVGQSTAAAAAKVNRVDVVRGETFDEVQLLTTFVRQATFTEQFSQLRHFHLLVSSGRLALGLGLGRSRRRRRRRFGGFTDWRQSSLWSGRFLRFLGGHVDSGLRMNKKVDTQTPTPNTRAHHENFINTLLQQLQARSLLFCCCTHHALSQGHGFEIIIRVTLTLSIEAFGAGAHRDSHFLFGRNFCGGSGGKSLLLVVVECFTFGRGQNGQSTFLERREHGSVPLALRHVHIHFCNSGNVAGHTCRLRQSNAGISSGLQSTVTNHQRYYLTPTDCWNSEGHVLLLVLTRTPVYVLRRNTNKKQNDTPSSSCLDHLSSWQHDGPWPPLQWP